jgi:tRNA (cytidine/uridine-2'-O-)-methyltransferase
LDYWHKIDLKVWESIEDFFVHNPLNDRFFFATTKTDTPYFEHRFKEGDFLVFGSETSGIPASILEASPNLCMTIPMTKEGRSLNLAISTGIIVYEAIKQNFDSYKGLMA